jgi:hypothetical protein
MSAHSPEEVHDVLMAAFTAGDVEGFVRTYEEDATLVVPPDEVLVHGRDEIRRAVAPTFALKPRGEVTVLKKIASDGLALTQAGGASSAPARTVRRSSSPATARSSRAASPTGRGRSSSTTRSATRSRDEPVAGSP